MPAITNDRSNNTPCQQPRAMTATSCDSSDHGRRQQPRATAATTSDDNNHEQRQQPRATTTTTSDSSNDGRRQQPRATAATTGDASNSKRCHIVFSFSITEHRSIHLANCLIMPAIMRDGSNYTRCRQQHAMPATTSDSSNHE